jgi:ribosomal protein S18 acetylase RimI-like enzyme
MTNGEVEVTVRPMSEDDSDNVLTLGGDLISREDLLAFELGAPFDVSFVAEAAGQIIGFTLARIHYVGIPLTKVCVIGGIVVEHEYRRHGIGNKLVEKIFVSCREKGVDTVRTLVEEGNVQVRRFVEQLGFRNSIISNLDKNLQREC